MASKVAVANDAAASNPGGRIDRIAISAMAFVCFWAAQTDYENFIDQ